MRSKERGTQFLLAGLAHVEDDQLLGEVDSPQATSLLQAIVGTPVDRESAEAATWTRDELLRAARRRRRPIVLLAALFVGIAVPAFGLAQGWFAGSDFAGVKGSAPPELSAAPVVVASGEPAESWTILVAESDQGVCLNVDIGDEQFHPPNYRLGDCGYSDLRGDLPRDVRGDSSAPCIGPPAFTQPVPCGSLPKYRVSFAEGSILGPDFRSGIFVGTAAVGVAHVDLVLSDGKTAPAHVVDRPLGPDVPLNVYWAQLGPNQGLRACRWQDENGKLVGSGSADFVQEVVARNSAGTVVDVRVAPWSGNPTGDPTGPRRPATLEKNRCASSP